MTPREKGEAQPSASPSPRESSTPKVSGRKLNIVVVEDSATDVFLVEEALDHHNIDAVLTCHRDGEEMLHYLDKINDGSAPCPDVVLLDLNLPKHNGKTVLARLRESPVCGRVPVVIVTSSRAVEDQADVNRLGATRYFYKSIDFDESMTLGAVVLEVTQRSERS